MFIYSTTYVCIISTRKKKKKKFVSLAVRHCFKMSRNYEYLNFSPKKNGKGKSFQSIF